jgi:short-subunit dehydrogenase
MSGGANRVALVTGASRGIGREVALGLADAGFALGLLARNKTALDSIAADVRDCGARAVAVTADVVDGQAVAAAVASVAGALGGIDLLVNNAGAIEAAEKRFVETDVEETWRVVEVNVRGPILVTHAVLPGMLARGGGRIVNVNSGAAYRAMTNYTGYAVSKGALARFTMQLDAQYRDRGVFTFDVAPGVVATEMTAGMPVHDGRTEWTPAGAIADLVIAIGDGRLDELSGRFFRAGTDTVESLLLRRDEIVQRDARVLRLALIDPDDPLA